MDSWEIIYQRLYIGELREENGKFHLGKETVKYVDIVGTLISISRRDKFTKMEVDDNTAIIQCILFHNNEEEDDEEEEEEEAEEEEEESETKRKAQEELAALIRSINERKELKRKRPLEIGDLVKMTGRLTVYKGCWQINVATVVRVEDCNYEWFYVMVVDLYRKLHKSESKPIWKHKIRENELAKDSNGEWLHEWEIEALQEELKGEVPVQTQDCLEDMPVDDGDDDWFDAWEKEAQQEAISNEMTLRTQDCLEDMPVDNGDVDWFDVLDNESQKEAINMTLVGSQDCLEDMPVYDDDVDWFNAWEDETQELNNKTQ